MSQSFAADAENASTPVVSALYRAVWRWHFYAGLLVLPFLVSIAITGGIYLFKDEINGMIYGQLMHVAPSSAAEAKPSELLAAALAKVPGAAIGYMPPPAADRAAQVRIAADSGSTQVVFVDPHTREVTGASEDGGFAGSPLMLTIRHIHSLKVFGWFAERLVEIVGGWAMILVMTGIYLWWPRTQTGGVVTVRGTPGRRVFWRDLHAVTGLFVGVFLLFLALTGMPWSGYWGNHLNTYANAWGFGYPAQFWDNVPKSTVPMKEAMEKTSWTLENQPMPVSMPNGLAPIGIDKAIAIFETLGLAKGYSIDLPGGAEGVYSASIFPKQVAGERVVHIDQYSGKTLFDGGFKEEGLVAKGIEWGVSVHTGQEFGRFNQLLMLAACMAIVLMAVSAAVMWWKRRPKGRLGAPAFPADYRVPRGILVIATAMGLAFPLVGLSMLVMMAIDWLLPRSLRARLA